MGRFEGRVAVITGGACGIGAAAARRFHAEGASVLLAGLNAEAGEALAWLPPSEPRSALRGLPDFVLSRLY